MNLDIAQFEKEFGLPKVDGQRVVAIEYRHAKQGEHYHDGNVWRVWSSRVSTEYRHPVAIFAPVLQFKVGDEVWVDGPSWATRTPMRGKGEITELCPDKPPQYRVQVFGESRSWWVNAEYVHPISEAPKPEKVKVKGVLVMHDGFYRCVWFDRPVRVKQAWHIKHHIAHFPELAHLDHGKDAIEVEVEVDAVAPQIGGGE